MSDQKSSEASSIEDEKPVDISSKLSHAQQAFLALKSTMDQEAEALLKERESFEIMRKKLDNIHFKKHIKLNVGGQIFKTSIETLVKDPDSMLASMFSERFDVKPDEEDGAYFIDRDGTHFRLILNYLRTGELIYPRENKIVARELYREAEFYQLAEIQKEVWQEIAFEKSNFIINSLTEEKKSALMSWLLPEENFATWVQLYSSTQHGWTSASFHQRCDNKGPTVVIAMASNFIFGGYTKVSWNSGSAFVQDKDAFLFTLTNATGASPTKLPQSNGNAGIHCNSSYGPTFGASNGCAIYFMSSTSTTNCSIINGAYGFTAPGGYALPNFIYTTSFNMSYLEVFGLKQTCS